MVKREIVRASSLNRVTALIRERCHHFMWEEIRQKGFTARQIESIRPFSHRQRLGQRSLYRLGATSKVWYLDSVRPGQFHRRFFFYDNVIRELSGTLNSVMRLLRASDDGSHFARLSFKVYMAAPCTRSGSFDLVSQFKVGSAFILRPARALKDVEWENVTRAVTSTGKLPDCGKGEWTVINTVVDIGLVRHQHGEHYQPGFFLGMGRQGLLDMIRAYMPPRPPLVWIQHADLEIVAAGLGRSGGHRGSRTGKTAWQYVSYR